VEGAAVSLSVEGMDRRYTMQKETKRRLYG
jgi:hypothetical protein